MRKNNIYVPDCLFPTDNDFEIPTLRLDVKSPSCVLVNKREVRIWKV